MRQLEGELFPLYLLSYYYYAITYQLNPDLTELNDRWKIEKLDSGKSCP
jgi:hypothetical protein